MSDNEKIPVTDEYNLSIKVDVQNSELLNNLRASAHGNMPSVSMPNLIKILVGRGDIKVIENDYDDTRYDVGEDTIYYDRNSLTLDRPLCVSRGKGCMISFFW